MYAITRMIQLGKRRYFALVKLPSSKSFSFTQRRCLRQWLYFHTGAAYLGAVVFRFPIRGTQERVIEIESEVCGTEMSSMRRALK